MSKVNKMLLNAVLITSALVSGQALAQSDGLAGSWTLTNEYTYGRAESGHGGHCRER